VTEALVLRRTPVGEADWMLSLFTPGHGVLSASAGSARRASSKLGVIDALHGLEVELEIVSTSEIAKLRASKLVRPRMGILDDPARLDEATRILRWVRSTVGGGTPEASGFARVSEALDALDRGEPPREVVLRAGLGLLDALGYALELERCTSCGRTCPEGAPALISPVAGGLVCRACGGGPLRLEASQRVRLAALARGASVGLDPALVDLGGRLVDDALAAHAARPDQARAERAE
jgi:DNA repair protein RecO (recombination protein O)